MFEVELFDGGLLVGDCDLDAVPAVGEVFEANGFEMRVIAVRESANGSDAAIDVEYVL
jgi:hypothetical protein